MKYLYILDVTQACSYSKNQSHDSINSNNNSTGNCLLSNIQDSDSKQLHRWTFFKKISVVFIKVIVFG